MSLQFLRHWRFPLAFAVTVVTAILLWAAYQAFPCPVTAVLTPIYDNPWEWGKYLFWPTLSGVVVLRHYAPMEEEKGGECMLLILLPMLTMLGRLLLPRVSPAVLCAVVLLVGLALYGTVLRRKVWGGALLWYALAALLGIAYLLLTALPPQGVLFFRGNTAVMNTIPY